MWPFDIQKPVLGRLERLESLQDRPAIEPLVDQHTGEIERLQGDWVRQHDQLELFQTKLKDLTIAVAEGIENVARKERRIGATLARAKKELAERGLEAEGIDAEVAELSEVDGAGSDEPRLPAVPSQMEVAEPEISSVPGVPLHVMRQVRGLQ